MDERLYKTRSGVIFDDVFPAMLNLQEYYVNDATSTTLSTDGLLIRHHTSQDVRVLKDMPPSMGAAEVTLAYTPMLEHDKAGFMLFDNSANTAQLLEYADRTFTDLTSIKVHKHGDLFDFFMKHEEFLHIDSVQFPFTKMGFVAKAGSTAFEPLHVTRFLCTTSNVFSLQNVDEGYRVTLETASQTFEAEAATDGYVELPFDHLEQQGTLRIFDTDGHLVSEAAGSFYAGDEYTFGSYLVIRKDGVELSTLSPTALGRLTLNALEVKFDLHNPSDVRAFNIELRISKYMSLFGYEWADIALDENGAAGAYQDVLVIPLLEPHETIEFWVKIERTSAISGTSVFHFLIDLSHD